ncbi:hypothetical protein EGH21_05465 [Halomicroarcula sp. F13]|uniref:Uncharacterized protein n=1 Tax=Haloarcula rubra TaxID=2487747 RepID=A0AAW4PPK8_9EURY|nr:hypothetical protein [Halomicroarcula rubra]MBX0322475.1 hypothetical protein [Halomicroarcula rubra]
MLTDKLQRAREAKAEIQNPHESERIRAIAEVLATIQTETRGAVMDQRDTLGVETDDDTDRLDKSERVGQILDVVDGYGPGGPSLAEIWLRQCAPDDLNTEDPEALAQYAEMSHEEWTAQIERWAQTYRDSGADAMHSDRSLADAHVSGKWGVSLERFESVVVDWNAGDALTDLLGGPSEATEEAVRANTEALA